jgi:hypothetical protein
VHITWLRLIKNLTPGRKRVWARIKLFCELQGRVSPEDLNKKIYGDCQYSRNVPDLRQIVLLVCTRWETTSS